MNLWYAINRYVVFDLESQAKVTIHNRYSRANEYIYVEGEFADGEKLEANGVNFSETSKRLIKNPFQFCVSIENKKSSINSLQLEGYESFPKVIIPKVENCS